MAFHPLSSPGTVRIEPEVHVGSDSLHESDTSYTQPHTCFYTAYRHVSPPGMELVQVGADAVGGAGAYTFGVA
jgi:hypothetical protein